MPLRCLSIPSGAKAKKMNLLKAMHGFAGEEKPTGNFSKGD